MFVKSRSRRRIQRHEQGNTSSYVAPKFQSGSTIRSHSPRLQKKITSPYIYVWQATSPPPWQRLLGVTSAAAKATRKTKRLLWLELIALRPSLGRSIQPFAVSYPEFTLMDRLDQRQKTCLNTRSQFFVAQVLVSHHSPPSSRASGTE